MDQDGVEWTEIGWNDTSASYERNAWVRECWLDGRHEGGIGCMRRLDERTVQWMHVLDGVHETGECMNAWMDGWAG